MIWYNPKMERRLKAEWEKQEHIQIVFPHKNSDWNCCLEEIRECYKILIGTIAKYEPVLVICENKKETKKYFSSTKNIFFIELQTNDTWIRDFGGIEIEEKGEIVTLDFGFNAWGLKFAANYDNLVTRELFRKKVFTTPLKTIDFILEGGSIESNGKGTLLTTSKCLLEPNRNPSLSKQEIENKLKEFFNLKQVLFLNYGHLEGDDTDAHIDTIARFIDENTIAYIKCEDKEDFHFKEFEKMEKELQTFGFDLVTLPFVKPIYYEGERLPATYANFLFINNAILVPIYKDPSDEKTIKIFEKLFTDRDIIPIDSRVLIRQHGSIHCATMQSFKKIGV